MHSRSFIMPCIGVLGDIDFPRCAPKQADGCFRRMYRTPTSSSANARKKFQRRTGTHFSVAPTLITHRTSRTCREMQPLHLDDDARASSLLRRVTGDLYIGGSSTGPAPVSHSVIPRRDATFATMRDSTPRHRMRYSRIRGTSCTSSRCFTTTLRPHAMSEEGNVQCHRSLTIVDQRHPPVPFTHLAHPFLAVVPPPSPSFFLC